MESLKAELARRKEALRQSHEGSGSSGGKKWVRRGEADALKAQAAAPQPAANGSSSSSSSSSSSAAAPPMLPSGSAQQQAATPAHAQSAAAASDALLPPAEVARQLREHGQVATYFGETDAARAERLRRHGLARAASDREEPPASSGGVELGTSASGPGHSGRGPTDDAGDGVDAPSQPSKRQRVTPGEPDCQLDGAPSSDAAAAGRAGLDADDAGSVASGASREGRGVGGGGGKARRGTSADAAAYAGGDKSKYVYKYFKGLLHEWEDELDARSDADKASATGLAATRLIRQCKDFIRPFFRQCKSRGIPADIIALSAEIVDHCRARNYHLAGDAYIRMAIGNSAWPIGVSAVGLHERAAREKVGEGVQAHVMNDEAQRKYITTMKRLISFAQGRYPSDPSRMMTS